jgi:N-glycosylase/DNA lyase
MAQGMLGLPGPFSLGLTLLCGQCFRWEGPDEKGWFYGAAGRVSWRLKQESEVLHWRCSSPVARGQKASAWLRHYLGLDADWESRTSSFQKHPALKKPLKLLKGLRILRQEPWECAVSFMFAQRLSVKVIRRALKKFCARFGESIAPGIHAFPEPAALSSLSPAFLSPYTNNYRARAERIIRMARLVEKGFISLDGLRDLPCHDARQTLMALEGIGPKIADCILLFSLGQESAFPLDRWVLRAMKKHFRSIRFLGLKGEAPTKRQYFQIAESAKRVFGNRCGIAGEYLFLYLRMMEDGKLREELSPFCRK